MSSGLSSDQIIKNEIIEKVGTTRGNVRLRIFPEGSNDDQILFEEGGLTFGEDGIFYGSCDAVWYINNKEWIHPYNHEKLNEKPIIALEGTDALQRGSSGNAQYQRFHHALGAVRIGLIGIYYLKPGKSPIQVDLYEMAYNATIKEKGIYLIIQDLEIVNQIIDIIIKFGEESNELKEFLDNELKKMHEIWLNNKFLSQYDGDWEKFADARSTIIEDERIIKYAARSKRNFTDSSQRAGHIAVGEMYLSKYFFYDKEIDYVFLRMTKNELEELDSKDDKEWNLLRNEENVEIKTLDDIFGLPKEIREALLSIKDKPLKGDALKIYKESAKKIVELIKTGKVVVL